MMKECGICYDIAFGNGKIVKNFFENKNGQIICADCYYSFGLPQDVDKN